MACQVWHKDYTVVGMEQQSLFQYISVADTLKQGQLLPYPRFLQRTHCRNECPCLHCGTHLCKKRTATQATFINARSKDKSKGKRKNAIGSCFGHNQVHKTADNSIQNIKQTEKLPAGYTQYHDYT